MLAGSHLRYRGVVLRSMLLLNVFLLASTARAEPTRTAQAAPAPAVPPAAATPAPAAPPAAAPAPAEPAAPATPPPAAPPGPLPADAAPVATDADYIEQSEADVVRVTVDRRSKSLQDLSASAESFSEEDLERKGVVSLRELTAVSPFVEVGLAEGNFEIFIRGVGNSNDTEIGDPSAAAHIDGIYIPRPRGLGSVYYDLERVELLRGPQGTLRGRNATAGSLNIVTAQPKLGEWGARGTFQFGNYMQKLTKGMVNIPIGDRLALRFATFTETHDPFYKNQGGNENIRASEDANTLAYRASLKWAPTDHLTVIIRHDNTFERGTGWPGTNVTQALQRGILPEEIPDVRALSYRGHQGQQSLDHWGVSADITLDTGPVSIQLLSSYRDMNFKQLNGDTAGAIYPGKEPADLDNYTSQYWNTTSQSTVNELRLFSPDTSRFRWTVGVFHLYESQNVFLGQANDKSWGWAGAEYNYKDIKDGAIAGYADGTFDITKALRVLAGFRLTHDYKHRNGVGYGLPVGCKSAPDASSTQADIDSCNASNRQFRYGTEGFTPAGLDRTDYTYSGNLSDYTNGITRFGARDDLLVMYQRPGAQAPTMTEQHGQTSSTVPDFRVGVEHNLLPQNMVYATFTTGYRAGGFNDTISDGTSTYAPEYGPERVYATEIGSKNTFADRRITLNASAFWYAYTDYQASNVVQVGPGVVQPGTGQINAFNTSLRTNVGDARILGLEIESWAKVSKTLKAQLSVSFLDARFLGAWVADTRAGWGANDQPIVNLEGNFLPRAPRLALSYGLSQSIPTSVGYFRWSASGQTKSKMYMTQFNGEGTRPDGTPDPVFSDVVPWTQRYDASVGYTRPQGDIWIEAFVSNITNMTYMTSLINVPSTNLRFYNPPRQMGVRLTMEL